MEKIVNSSLDRLASFKCWARTSLVLLTGLGIASCQTGGGIGNYPGIKFPSSAGIGSSHYRTSVGDAIEIFVLEDSSFNGVYVVRPSGDIILPKAGRISVENMSLGEVESTVSGLLKRNQLINATVIADPVRRGPVEGDSAAIAGLTVYLSGSVAKKGRSVVPFVGGSNVTAYQAITDSGGFAAFANKRKSYVLRRDPIGNQQRIPVNFVAIEKGEAPDVSLQDGDTIVVPQKLFGF